MNGNSVLEGGGSGESLRQSLAYSAVGNLGVRGITLLGSILLARLLSPREFGLMAMVTIFSGIAELFLNMRMDAALIHNRQANERHYATVFWLNLGIGVMFSGLMILGAEAAAGFFGSSEIVPIMRVTAILFPLDALVVVPVALLKKQLMFRKIARIELISALCGLSAGILLAFNGWGVWALVANLLTNAFVQAVLVFADTRWHPRLVFGRDELAELWRYSGYLVGTSIFTYAIGNVDYLMIGKLIGARALGAYKYAFQIATFPRQVVYGVLNRVLFSFYSSAESKDKVVATHLRMMRMVAFFVLPFYLGLSAITDHFVMTVLGRKWEETIPILGLLLVIFMLEAINDLNGPLYLSGGETKLLFRLSIFLRIDLIVFMVIGIYANGIQGLLIGLLLAKIINYFPSTFFSSRLVGLTIRDVTANIAPMMLSSIAMSAVVRFSEAMLFSHPGRIADLAGLIITGVLTYLLIALMLQKHVVTELRQGLWPRGRPTPAG